MTGRHKDKLNGLYWQIQSAKKLCQGLDTNSNGDGGIANGASAIIDAIEGQTTSLNAMLNPRKDFIVDKYCDNGVFTGMVIQIWNEEDESFSLTYLDNNYNPIPSLPLGTICVFNDDYEYKHFESICFTDGANTYFKYVCLPILNGVEQTEIIIWKDAEGNTVLEPSGVQLCSVEITTPVEDEFFGNSATLSEFNEITIFIPKCCEVEYTTSAGSVTLQAQQTDWVYVTSFDNNVLNYIISSTCVDDIQTILKLK